MPQWAMARCGQALRRASWRRACWVSKCTGCGGRAANGGYRHQRIACGAGPDCRVLYWIMLECAPLSRNLLRVFRSAHTAHLGRGVGQEQWLRVRPSEKYAARCVSLWDDMRTRTACFARAPQRCTKCLSKHFLLTFQEVTSLTKTRNQLIGCKGRRSTRTREGALPQQPYS